MDFAMKYWIVATCVVAAGYAMAVPNGVTVGAEGFTNDLELVGGKWSGHGVDVENPWGQK